MCVCVCVCGGGGGGGGGGGARGKESPYLSDVESHRDAILVHYLQRRQCTYRKTNRDHNSVI